MNNLQTIAKSKVLQAIYLVLLIISLENIGFGQTMNSSQKASKADAIFAEAMEEAKQGTADSMRASLPKFEKARSIYKEIGDKKYEASCLGWLGNIYNALGEKQKALEFYNQVLPLRRQSGDKSEEAATLNDIGLVYNALGEKQKALEFHNQALPIFKQIGDKQGEANTLNNIGGVYVLIGEKQKALEFYNQALLLQRRVGDKRGEALTLNNIGGAYNLLGEKQKTLEFYNQALPIFRQIGDKPSEAMMLNNIGFTYNALGEKQKALQFYNQVLPLIRQIGYRAGEAATLNNIGGVYDDLGEKQKALEFYNQALPILKAIGEKQNEAEILNTIMYAWESLQNFPIAIYYGKQSINKFQELRRNIKGLDKENQKTFLKSIEKAYRKLADLLIKQNRLAEAHQVLNSFKDQQFFDFDQSNIKEFTPLKLTSRENEFISLYEKASEDRLLAVLKKAEAEFSKKLDAKDLIGEVPDLKQMQAALLRLKKETGRNAAAVYQVVGEENFSALVITPDSIEKVEVPFKGAELNEKALQLWGLLQTDKYDTTKLSKEIYDVVFAPLEAKLPKDTTTIMWALDGNLRYLPMAALFDGKRFLVERYTHSVFTRADAERMTRKVSDIWTGTGFGSSQSATVEVLGSDISFAALPGVTKELSEIFKTGGKGIIGGETFSDKKFSKPNFISAMKQKRPLVHIASHFAFRPGDEARSFLLMGDATTFTLEEMKREENLFEGVELLTLSACNTAATQPGANGREIDGFAELAQRLGAGAVMATLWQVSDASTPWLMRDFYATRETKTGMTKSEALQRAQLDLLNGTADIAPQTDVRNGGATPNVEIVVTPDGKPDNKQRGTELVYVAAKDAPLFKKDKEKPFAHPFYWSPFVLYGNWK